MNLYCQNSGVQSIRESKRFKVENGEYTKIPSIESEGRKKPGFFKRIFCCWWSGSSRKRKTSDESKLTKIENIDTTKTSKDNKTTTIEEHPKQAAREPLSARSNAYGVTPPIDKSEKDEKNSDSECKSGVASTTPNSNFRNTKPESMTTTKSQKVLDPHNQIKQPLAFRFKKITNLKVIYLVNWPQFRLWTKTIRTTKATIMIAKRNLSIQSIMK